MRYVRIVDSSPVTKDQNRLTGKRGLDGIIAPVALKIALGSLVIALAIMYYQTMLVPRNDIVQPLFGRYAQGKEQQHEAGREFLYRPFKVQFFCYAVANL